MSAIVWFNIAAVVFGCMIFFDRLSKPAVAVRHAVILPTDELRHVVAASDDRHEPQVDFNLWASYAS